MSMQPSKHNIVGKIDGSDAHFIVNPLSGNADILSASEAEALVSGSPEDTEALAARGYLVDPAEEKGRYRRAYLDFSADQDQDEIQIFYVPTYACNFGCSYCFQSDYAVDGSDLDLDEVASAFFFAVERMFGGRRKYITIFGGEPLLPGARHRAHLEAIVSGASRRQIPIAVVTNGYYLKDSLDLLTQAQIKEVQVTLDGLAEVHDARRGLKGGGPTFDVVVEGIDAALARGVTINLRVVVDRSNIDELAKLADFAVERGWTAHPLFKTQLGRSYDLHECQATDTLFDRIGMAKAVADISAKSSNFVKFHKPAFHVVKHLKETGELPAPTFDACPACKTEWAFDSMGRIFSCTATVGKADEELGRFYPELALEQDKVALYQDRNILAMDSCRDCSVSLICGGGCEAIARQANGRPQSPDCRPVKDILEVGMGHYFSNEV